VIQTIAPSGAITDTTYDLNGRVGSVSTPYYSKNDPTYGVTSFTYDALGRKTVQTQPGPGAYTQQWSYSGNTVTFTDENQNQWVRTSDALGRLTTVFEPNGTSSSPAMETDYGYDELGNLLTVKQWGGSYGSSGAVLRSFSYDSLSRLLTASNPESGSVSYTYDSDGNVKSKTDARNVTISYSYDALNRLLSKSYSDGTTPTSCYQYDSTTIANGKGRLANAWTQSASAACSLAAASWTKRSILAYDALGRILKEQQCTPSNCANGAPYSPAYTYDLAGNLLSSTSGVGPTPTSTPFIFSNTFDNAGRLHTLASNWTTNYVNGRPNIFPATLFSAQTVTSAMCPKSFTTPYAPFGSLVNASFGTALTLNRGFDQRLRTTCENDTGGNVATPTGGSVAVTITGSEQSK
jgi:YD repeat-containing protein